MEAEYDSYVCCNEIPEKRDGPYLLLFVWREQMRVSAFGLSVLDAKRACENGVPFVPTTDKRVMDWISLID